MPFKDPDARRAYMKDWYAKNRGTMVERSVRYRREVARPRNRAYVNEVKARLGCRRCGIKDHRVLDFHHLGDKEQAVALAVGASWSIRKLQAEIDKCIVLCANCHRIEHYEEEEALDSDELAQAG